MRDETEIAVYAAHLHGEKYDESSKKVFRNKEIIAPLLKFVVEEYKDYSIEEIITFIDADTISSEVPVSDISVEAADRGTEFSSITDKIVRYDVHLKVKNPKLSDEEKNILLMIYVDFEVQNDYKPSNPSYPVIKRAVYYVARNISAQLGIVTENTNYKSIQKVYSIWVCNENIPVKLQNTVTQYTIQRKDLIGETQEPAEDYDLINITIIRRGKESSDQDIFKYLNAVFSADLEGIKEYVGIKKDSKVEKEVIGMMGLGQSIYERGMELGMKRGIERGMERGIEYGELKKLISLIYKKMLKEKTNEEIAEEIEEDLSTVENIKEVILEYKRINPEQEFDAEKAAEYLKRD